MNHFGQYKKVSKQRPIFVHGLKQHSVGKRTHPSSTEIIMELVYKLLQAAIYGYGTFMHLERI